MTVLLDAGPLGYVSNPKGKQVAEACKTWLKNLVENDVRICIPEIADYEVRRELIRAGKIRGIERLDDYKNTLLYLPITTSVMLQAAQFWAQARQQGYPTAHAHALDGDVIIAAQAATLVQNGYQVTVATTNVKHLQKFIHAQEWQDITLSNTTAPPID